MNIQSEPVTCSMKKTLHPPFYDASFEAFTLEVIRDGDVNIVGTRSVANTAECDVLTLFNAVIDMLQSIRCPPAHHSTCARQGRDELAARSPDSRGAVLARGGQVPP